MSPNAYDRVFGPSERMEIERLAGAAPPLLTAETWRDHPGLCGETEIIISSWGMPRANDEFLSAFPRLRAIFYGAGSIKGFATDTLSKRGILVCSARRENAVPVAEFSVAQIILAAKGAWRLAAETRAEKTFPAFMRRESAGMYGSTVGLISLGTIGRQVALRLQEYDVEVIAYDPLANMLEAAKLGVELTTLDEVFRRSDVISCHAPLLDETRGMLTGAHFAAMKPGATFINTARGPVIDEEGMVSTLLQRPDIWVVLDVASQEPPLSDSPLYELKNVFLTPHIAGSKGRECHRLGRAMVEEVELYLVGKPARREVNIQELVAMA